MNVFTLNSPAGHSARYVGRTRACVHVCVHICASKGDVAFTPPGVYGNANLSDDTVISVPLTENSSDNLIKVDEGWVGGL